MNQVKAIQRRNQLELEAGALGASSWHDEYKTSAYINVGGLDTDLTEGDVITIMSQYGEVADINMPRNKQTGKTQGFAFLMYEDQRSTVLAVDNLNGSQVLGRTLRVDHVKNYKQMERGEDGKMKERETQSLNALPENFAQEQAGGSGSDSPDPDIDPDDPMSAYLLEQKRERKRKRLERYGDETKEERRARKERKRAKKSVKEPSGLQMDRPELSSRDREDRRRRDEDSRHRYRDDSRERRHAREEGYGSDRDERRRRDARDEDRYRRDREHDSRSRRDERYEDTRDRDREFSSRRDRRSRSPDRSIHR